MKVTCEFFVIVLILLMALGVHQTARGNEGRVRFNISGTELLLGIPGGRSREAPKLPVENEIKIEEIQSTYGPNSLTLARNLWDFRHFSLNPVMGMLSFQLSVVRYPPDWKYDFRCPGQIRASDIDLNAPWRQEGVNRILGEKDSRAFPHYVQLGGSIWLKYDLDGEIAYQTWVRRDTLLVVRFRYIDSSEGKLKKKWVPRADKIVESLLQSIHIIRSTLEPEATCP